MLSGISSDILSGILSKASSKILCGRGQAEITLIQRLLCGSGRMLAITSLQRSGGDDFDPALNFGSGEDLCDHELAGEVGECQSDPGLAVRVRRGPLRSSACS